MKLALVQLFFAFSISTYLSGAPPSCKTTHLDGKDYDVCERVDSSCDSLTKQQLANPSPDWYGCIFSGSTIIKSYSVIAGMIVYDLHISLIPSYRDSERMDMTVTVEQSNHSSRNFVRKDVQVIIRDNVPSASADFISTEEILGVPTIEAVEKGGKKMVTHVYK